MSKELYAQSSLHRMVRYDARSEILSSLGDLSGLRLRGNQVILAPYVQSGIQWSDKFGFPIEERLSVDNLCELYGKVGGLRNYKSAEESIWQGKVCLVVAVGEEVNHPPCPQCRGSGYIVDSMGACGQCDGKGMLTLARTLVGSWVFTLQENTRGVGLQGANSQISRVLKELGAKYEGGWPCRFVYESDIYGDVDDPDMVV